MVFVTTTILDSFQMCVWSRLHTRSHLQYDSHHHEERQNWLVRGRIYKVRSSRQLYLLGPPQSTSVALA